MKNEALSKSFEYSSTEIKSVSSIKHAGPVDAVPSQADLRDINNRLDDVPLQSNTVRTGKLTIDDGSISTVDLENAGGRDLADQRQSADKTSKEFASGPAGNKGKLVALFAAVIVITGVAMLVSEPSSVLDEMAPQEKPVAPTAKSSQDIAKIENQLTTVSLSAEWRKFNIAADPDRPVIALSAKRPFRIRVNGELYLVAASSSPEINFGTANFMELRAVDGNTDVKITRSARLGMDDG